MGLEILREADMLGGDLDIIFVAIGGGGMIAGGCLFGQGGMLAGLECKNRVCGHRRRRHDRRWVLWLRSGLERDAALHGVWIREFNVSTDIAALVNALNPKIQHATSGASQIYPQVAGIAAVVKALNPKIQVIGVEPAGANAMCQASLS